MPAQPLPIIKDGVIGDVPINFYPAADSEKGVILQPSPGLSLHCHLDNCTEIRGCHTFPPNMYWVARRGGDSVLFRVDGSGGSAELGTIPTSSTGPVWMEHNTTQLLIVDGVVGQAGYVYTPTTGVFERITDLAFLGAGTCSAQDGYGLFTQPNTRTWFISNLYDFKSINALQFYVKESQPDNVVAVKSLLREPWVMGEKSIEVWGNVGGFGTNPTFMRNSGGLLEYGLGAAASVDVVNSRMMWLSDRRQWVQAIAYQPKVVSTQMMERAVDNFSKFDDAIAFTYTEGNHVFEVLTFPTANETWVWDDTTQLLHKRQSYLDDLSGQGRWRANCHTLYNSTHYVGDYSNGNVYKMSSGYYDDGGEEIRREFHMAEIGGGRQLIHFPAIEIGVKSGVGLISGLDPQIALQFSNDQGETWTSEVWRSAGLIGQYGKKALWTEMGADYRRMYRAVFTDPVFWQIQYVEHGS
jgi:hypothetical protein